jgi:hypothetical protein
MPPLTVTLGEIDEAINKLDSVLQDLTLAAGTQA